MGTVLTSIYNQNGRDYFGFGHPYGIMCSNLQQTRIQRAVGSAEIVGPDRYREGFNPSISISEEN